MSTKMLDKVSKLLAKAENAGTPEEAETFMAKAMELAEINAIDLAVARLHQAKKERVQAPEERTFQVNPIGRRHNRKLFVELATMLAGVNDTEYLLNDYYLFMIGYPEDLDVIEALFTHLSVQMVSECDDALKRGEHKEVRRVRVTEREPIAWEDRDWGAWNGKQFYDDNPDDDVFCARYTEDTDETYAEREAEATTRARAAYQEALDSGDTVYSSHSRNYEGGYRKPVPPPVFRDVPVHDLDDPDAFEEKEVSVVDGRVFRAEFYEAFIRRMRGRLWEIKKATQRHQGEVAEESSEVALALVDKKEAVKAAHAEQRAKVAHLGTYRGHESAGRKYDNSGRGQQAGREAAERVPVGEGREVKR